MQWLLFFAIAALTFFAFAAPDAVRFPHPELARIIFFHLPCALTCTLFFYFGAYLSWKVLRTKSRDFDIRAVSANEIGMVMATLTMVTGIIFSKTQWGQYWSWDPRQTSFLFVLLLYGAYFILRASFSDAEKRAWISAAYALFCVIPATFFIFVMPRIMDSLHPSTTLIKGEMDAYYKTIFYSLFLCVLVLCAWVYKLAVRAGLVELRVQTDYGNLEIGGGGPAPTGVVRPVSVPTEGGAQTGRG